MTTLNRAEIEAARSSFTQIPLIDLSPLKDGCEKSREKLAKDICVACETVGFLYIVNHGIPAFLLNKIFSSANDFFSLSPDEKLKLRLGAATGFRGYIPSGIDGGTSAGNLKEAFQILSENEIEVEDPPSIFNRPNVWPETLPEFRSTLMTYFLAADELSKTLLRLFAIGLNVPETTFSAEFDASLSMLRLLHYPPQPATERAIGSQPHTDTGAITILAQDNAGGLEAMNESGQWTRVEPIEGTLVVNIGGMMKLWSDGRFSATPHRVINASGKDRISIPFFANPNPNTIIVPVAAAKTRRAETRLVGHLEPGEFVKSGEVMLRIWNRLWGQSMDLS